MPGSARNTGKLKVKQIQAWPRGSSQAGEKGQHEWVICCREWIEMRVILAESRGEAPSQDGFLEEVMLEVR